MSLALSLALWWQDLFSTMPHLCQNCFSIIATLI